MSPFPHQCFIKKIYTQLFFPPFLLTWDILRPRLEKSRRSTLSGWLSLVAFCFTSVSAILSFFSLSKWYTCLATYIYIYMSELGKLIVTCLLVPAPFAIDFVKKFLWFIHFIQIHIQGTFVRDNRNHNHIQTSCKRALHRRLASFRFASFVSDPCHVYHRAIRTNGLDASFYIPRLEDSSPQVDLPTDACIINKDIFSSVMRIMVWRLFFFLLRLKKTPDDLTQYQFPQTPVPLDNGMNHSSKEDKNKENQDFFIN